MFSPQGFQGCLSSPQPNYNYQQIQEGYQRNQINALIDSFYAAQNQPELTQLLVNV
jgi:hypothetical protein